MKKLMINGQQKIPKFEELLSGKISLEDFLRLICAESDIVDYLHNEERIISLARQKQLAFMKRYSLSSLEEYLWKGLDETAEADDMNGIVTTLSNRFRKLLRDCAKENNFLPLENLINCEWWVLKIHLLQDKEDLFPARRSVLRGRHRYGNEKSNYAFGIEIRYPGEDVILRYAASDEVIKSDGVWRCSTNIRYTDLGVLLAKVFLAKSVSGWVKENEESKAEEYAFNPNFCIRWDTREAEFERHVDLLELVLKRYGGYGAVEQLSSSEIAFRKAHKLPFALLTDWEITRIFYKNPGDYLRDGYNPFFMFFDTSCDGRIDGVYLYNLKRQVFYVTSKKASEVKKAEKIREYESTSRAKSYQTKKNIPQKILKMMKSSEFNQYFDYVEFDEDCDVKLLERVGKEVLAFFKEMPKIQSYTKGNAIRFRKLGNHNAIGLYYPLIQCLCVDLRNTTSFIHELGHLIDHCMSDGGQLSEQPAFFNILSLYRKYLEENKKNIGKGKYDLNYYKEATEVFARSFELYIVKVKKYRNNLIPDSFSQTVYPEEREDIMEQIKNYFDSLDLIGECVEAKPTEGATEKNNALAQIEDAISDCKVIYVSECVDEKSAYPVEDARKAHIENQRFVFDDGLKLIGDCNGAEGCILALFNGAEEVAEYIEKHHLRIVRIESVSAGKKAASVVPAAEKEPEDLKKLSGQELLNAITAPKLHFNKEKECCEYDGNVKDWFDDLSRAFNSFGTGSYTIPDEWRNNKKFWQKLAYIEIVNLSKDVGTWDQRKALAAEVSSCLLLDAKLREHVEKIGGFVEERRGVDFFYLLMCEFRKEHSTIRQSMATFLMKYLYETDKVFEDAVDRIMPERANNKFRFPMV